MTVNFEKVSLTARLTAYMRQYSDIPFAKDVANRLQAEAAFEKLLRDNELSPKDLLWYAPILEVRYKSVAETIRKSRATQVLELASGFSLRGLAVTQDPKITYVESDLEELTDEKASLVADLRRQYRLAEHGNLRLVTADALDRNQLQSAAKSFRRDQPIAVVNEGLLQYLSATEMVMVARNIRDLLIEFDGVWITPDFSLKQDVKDVSEQQRRFRRVVAAATERTMYNNASVEERLIEHEGTRLLTDRAKRLDVRRPWRAEGVWVWGSCISRPSKATRGFFSIRKAITNSPVRRYCSGRTKSWFEFLMHTRDHAAWPIHAGDRPAPRRRRPSRHKIKKIES